MIWPIVHRLGKRARREDPRTFRLEKYLPAGIPPAPAEVSWYTHYSKPWGMLLNDALGDCVPAGMAHSSEQWAWYAQGLNPQQSDSTVLKAYEDIGGYVPGDPSTDNGCVMLDALKYWRQTGIGGHKVIAFMQVDMTNLDIVRQAIWMFGNLFTGLQLPMTAQGQPSWLVGSGPDAQPGSWGGHCVPIMAISPKSLTCITWGSPLKLSHNFFARYCDEAYAVLSQDWIEANGGSPGGFDLATLKADLAAL